MFLDLFMDKKKLQKICINIFNFVKMHDIVMLTLTLTRSFFFSFTLYTLSLFTRIMYAELCDLFS